MLRGRQPVEEEEVKVEIDHASLNDPKKGEFRIEYMKMKDAANGSVLWENSDWDLTSDEEKKVVFPKEMLECTELGREISFYSKKPMTGFAIRQVMSLNEMPIEEFRFDFGFVIPNTTNSWEQVIEVQVGEVLPAEVLSGNLVVDTYFIVNDYVFAS